MPDIDELVKELKIFAEKLLLSKAEHKEAVNLMRKLKAAGMSNEEISEASGGRWSASTVKGHTKGIKTQSPDQWQSAIGLLNTVLTAGISLDELESALAVLKDLNSKGIEVEQMIDIISSVDLSSIDLETFVEQHEQLAVLGISTQQVSKALALKDELGKMGITPSSFETLVELTKTFGEPEDIFKAISKYKNLTEIEDEIAAAKSKLQDVSHETNLAKQELDQTQTNISQNQEVIDKVNETVKLGFGIVELEKVSALADKYGGVKNVLNAVSSYAEKGELSAEIDQAKKKLSNIKSEVNKFEVEYGHLKTAITMCNVLINKHKYGLDAISTMLSVAKKFGEPVDVLKAIETYGKYEALQEQKDNLKGKITALGKEVSELESKHDEMFAKLESLNQLALEIGKEIGKVEGQAKISNDLNKIMGFVNHPVLADYPQHIITALVLSVALQKWVSANPDKFKLTNTIIPGLKSLISELGGLA